MKKQFAEPEIQVMTFTVEDIITTSGAGNVEDKEPDNNFGGLE